MTKRTKNKKVNIVLVENLLNFLVLKMALKAPGTNFTCSKLSFQGLK